MFGDDIFKDKTLLITGGTGSFGNAVLERFINSKMKEIRVFSRDELKQDNMKYFYRRNYPQNYKKIKFFLGDIRDIDSLKNAVGGVDFVFHAAALKQITSAELFPIEAVKTNILGTENVLNASIEAGVKKVICLSTDKAAYPISVMGATKSIMEKVAIAKSRTIELNNMTICCTRYGNILASRGSVVPLFVNQIRNGDEITITNPKMTRFIMTMEEAVDLVSFAFQNGKNGDIFVQKSPSATIESLAIALTDIFNSKNQFKIVGAKSGEKMYETLLTSEEMIKSIEMENFFRVPADDVELSGCFQNDSNDFRVDDVLGFNSNNTKILSITEIKEKLLKLKFINENLNI